MLHQLMSLITCLEEVLVVSECLRGEQSAGLRRWRSGFTDQHVKKKPTVWMSSEKESLILLGSGLSDGMPGGLDGTLSAAPV